MRGDRTPFRNGFTLIELLIVVAIIAILAAIAIPNFLEAQVRAKVSRVRGELRTIAIALEAYAADWNEHPLNDGFYNVLPIELTTPVSYITSSKLIDPFCSGLARSRYYGELVREYTYTRPVTVAEWLLHYQLRRSPPIEAIDGFNPNVFKKYGQWRLVSNGPDQVYSDPNYVFGREPVADPYGVIRGADTPYDSTNGTVSGGNILRTQLSPEGKIGWP